MQELSVPTAQISRSAVTKHTPSTRAEAYGTRPSVVDFMIFLLSCAVNQHEQLLILGPLRHAELVRRCPLFGADQKSHFGAVRAVVDPDRTSQFVVTGGATISP